MWILVFLTGIEMAKIKKSEFIITFQGCVGKMLEKILPDEFEEAEGIDKAYSEIYKRLRHIKTGQ